MKKWISVLVCLLLIGFLSTARINDKFVSRFSSEQRIYTVSQQDAEKLNTFPFTKKLVIVDFQSDDISFIRHMPFLKQLSLYFCRETITDFSALASCKHLEVFSVDGQSDFDDLSCFSGLEHLKSLWIGDYFQGNIRIRSLDGIESLSPTLENLTLNGIEQETALSTDRFPQLTALHTLCVFYTSLEEITVNHDALTHLWINNNPELKTVRFQNADSIERIGCYGSPNLILPTDDLLRLPALQEILIDKNQLSENDIALLEAQGITVTIIKEDNE